MDVDVVMGWVVDSSSIIQFLGFGGCVMVLQGSWAGNLSFVNMSASFSAKRNYGSHGCLVNS